MRTSRLLFAVVIAENSLLAKTDSSTRSPEGSFVVRYAGGIKAGFSDHLEGNEATVPFVASPNFGKEISILLNDCTTPIPEELIIAASQEKDVANSANLNAYDVSLALNITTLSMLKNDSHDDAIWQGIDNASDVLTFCMRVDLMSDTDLAIGDGLHNKTSVVQSVSSEEVLIDLEIDFSAEVPTISTARAEPRSPQQVLVTAQVYGVTGCHCDAAASTCYDDNNTAPALTLDDTLDVCFRVSAAGVSVASVTSFAISQRDLSFDALLAGSNFYTASYSGSSVIFRSLLTSAFFNDFNTSLTVSATLELSFSRRLRGSSSTVTNMTKVLESDDWSSVRPRNLEGESHNTQVTVVIEVDGVVSRSDADGFAGLGNGEFGGSLPLILVCCIAFFAVSSVLISLSCLLHQLPTSRAQADRSSKMERNAASTTSFSQRISNTAVEI